MPMNEIKDLKTSIDILRDRMDDRMDSIDEKLNEAIESHADTKTKVALLELRAQSAESLKASVDKLEEATKNLELKTQTISFITDNQESKWKAITGFVVQIVWAVLAGYLLYKLGLPSP